MTYCTLFDSNYLDKGLVMIDSLNRVCKSAIIYVLAMDELCYKVIKDINNEQVKVIGLEEFMDETLKQIKLERSSAEFCWTCTSHLINFVISNYNVNCCTYIDSDLYFYSDPTVLLEEMGEKDAQIIKHGFCKNLEGLAYLLKSGRYCVEFNTIKNTEHGMELLKTWMHQCDKSCSTSEKGIFGDQMYLNSWRNDSRVSVVKNLGGGVAPWNIGKYVLKEKNGYSYVLRRRFLRRKFNLVFYHFHMINYIDRKTVNINVHKRFWCLDEKLVKELYFPYLKALDEKKEFLNSKYGFVPLLIEHPAQKPVSKSFFDYIKGFDLSYFLKAYVLLVGRLRGRINSDKDIIEL